MKATLLMVLVSTITCQVPVIYPQQQQMQQVPQQTMQFQPQPQQVQLQAMQFQQQPVQQQAMQFQQQPQQYFVYQPVRQQPGNVIQPVQFYKQGCMRHGHPGPFTQPHVIQYVGQPQGQIQLRQQPFPQYQGFARNPVVNQGGYILPSANGGSSLTTPVPKPVSTVAPAPVAPTTTSTLNPIINANNQTYTRGHAFNTDTSNLINTLTGGNKL